MPEIHVCTVLPAALDTPIYRSAGNYFGRTVRAIIPVNSPESAARIVVRLVERTRAEALVGTVAYALMLAARLAPRVIERMVGQQDCSSRKKSRLQLAGICSRVLIPARLAMARILEAQVALESSIG
ncbi:hypothetical protein [Sinorhizobium meliloti]|uniref:hypothetical protein n=1 Tax=Rhizobium meliloti TaxID=382 RepID=UPI001267CF38|nr:hypothetical protein [Sinorhizobium meliloti]